MKILVKIMKGVQMITKEAFDRFEREQSQRPAEEVARLGNGTILAEKLAAAIHAGLEDRDAARAEATQYYFDNVASVPTQAETTS